MEKLYTVILHDGADQHEFIHDMKNIDGTCSCSYHCDNIPGVLLLKLNESQYNELVNHPSVKEVEPDLSPPAHPSLPSFFLKTRTFTGALPPITLDPTDYGPLQFYYFNDQIDSNGLNIGTHRWSGNPQPPNDDSTFINGKYLSCWLGKNVDIVSLEVIDNLDTLVLSTPHPDFVKIDNPSEVKFIKNNWPGLSNILNSSQVENTEILGNHAIGVLSAAAGTYCGYAKKSNVYCLYLEPESEFSPAASIDSVIAWHNSKPNNPETGVPNPTILIHEYQYLYSNYYMVKIEDINQINYYNHELKNWEVINRPSGGWGNDFTPFTTRNFNIKRILEQGTYYWCVSIGVTSSTSISNAIQSAYNNGIINIVPAGNDCGVYVKQNDPNYNAYVVIDIGSTYFFNNRGDTTLANISIQGPTVALTTFYPFRNVGPAGSPYAIDVAAGQNSERYPILDRYSVRGPGIDIVGLGSNTFTSYPGILFADGNFWGMFSGTSCAAPTVAGILACLLEKYYYYHGEWPTVTQAKEILIGSAKKNILMDAVATTWNNVPSASVQMKGQEIAAGPLDMNLIYDGIGINGGIATNELLGTVNCRAFIDTTINKINSFEGQRPVSGQTYPRNKIKIG